MDIGYWGIHLLERQDVQLESPVPLALAIITYAGMKITYDQACIHFFILVFALSIPFYLLGISGMRLPGLSILPASALMTFVPTIAALVLVYRQRGIDSINALLTYAFDFNRHNGMGWILVALLFIPVVCTL